MQFGLICIVGSAFCQLLCIILHSFQGVQGPRGSRGDKGDQGKKGDQGHKGDAGFDGILGGRGDVGLKGNQGTQGTQGVVVSECRRMFLFKTLAALVFGTYVWFTKISINLARVGS